jgi:hypothetical protein
LGVMLIEAASPDEVLRGLVWWDGLVDGAGATRLGSQPATGVT